MTQQILINHDHDTQSTRTNELSFSVSTLLILILDKVYINSRQLQAKAAVFPTGIQIEILLTFCCHLLLPKRKADISQQRRKVLLEFRSEFLISKFSLFTCDIIPHQSATIIKQPILQWKLCSMKIKFKFKIAWREKQDMNKKKNKGKFLF